MGQACAFVWVSAGCGSCGSIPQDPVSCYDQMQVQNVPLLLTVQTRMLLVSTAFWQHAGMRHRTKPRVDTTQVPSLVYYRYFGVRVQSQRGAPSQCARDTGKTCRHERSEAHEWHSTRAACVFLLDCPFSTTIPLPPVCGGSSIISSPILRRSRRRGNLEARVHQSAAAFSQCPFFCLIRP